jgi:aerobic carbon-monoxide dehydrogenase medium subunit
MHDFSYHRPARVAEAAALLAREGFKPLAGGMSLIPALKLRLARYDGLVDLGGIAELDGVRRENGEIAIGAMTPHAAVAASPEIARTIPALASLAGGIGDPLVRNRGTVGGSIANADPAADYPAAILGLGATVVTNQRSIAGDEFFKGLFETALEPGEIVIGVRFPVPEKAAYLKLPQPASRFAMVGVFVARTASGVRVAVTGAGPSVFRVPAAEAALERSFAPSALDGITVSADGLNSDIHASAEYRAACIGVLMKRAVREAR